MAQRLYSLLLRRLSLKDHKFETRLGNRDRVGPGGMETGEWGSSTRGTRGVAQSEHFTVPGLDPEYHKEKTCTVILENVALLP